MKITKVAQAFEEEERYEGESDAVFVNRLQKSLDYWKKLLESETSKYIMLESQMREAQTKMKKYEDNLDLIEEQMKRNKREV